ncbi:MAG TPA: hypothetical protein VK689_22260, partial [Armatimonadota bacterium]|nr:hypothetical protein [Armatimonadota bacterium]
MKTIREFRRVGLALAVCASIAALCSAGPLNADDDPQPGDIVEFTGVGVERFNPGNTFIARVLLVRDFEPKYKVRILSIATQIPQGGVVRDAFVESPKVRAWNKPFVDEWTPEPWYGAWAIGNTLARNTLNVQEQADGSLTADREQSVLRVPGVLVIRPDNTFTWRVTSDDVKEG